MRLPRSHTGFIRPIDSAFVFIRFAAVITTYSAYHPRFGPGLFANPSSSDEFLCSSIPTRYSHPLTFLHVQPFSARAPTMASADFLMDIPLPHDAGSIEATNQDLTGYFAITFPLMPIGYTSWGYEQVLGFADTCQLTPPCRLVSASCASGQRFASGFLQIRSYPRHPCRSASSSPYRPHTKKALRFLARN